MVKLSKLHHIEARIQILSNSNTEMGRILLTHILQYIISCAVFKDMNEIEWARWITVQHYYKRT